MQVSRIEGLAWSIKPVALSMSLANRIAGDLSIGNGTLTPEQADLDPRQQRHLSPATADPPTEGERAEAQRQFVQAMKLCRPASPALVAYWCARLRALPGGPESEARAQEMIGGICLACGDLPGAVWSNENLAEALRTFTRWPAPAQVYAFAAEKARPFWRIRDGLRRILDEPVAAPVVEPRVPPSPQAIAEVEAVTRALRAEFRRFQPPQPLVAGKTATAVSAGALLATYERLAAQGVAGAGIRVEMLRKQLAQEASP